MGVAFGSWTATIAVVVLSGCRPMFSLTYDRAVNRVAQPMFLLAGIVAAARMATTWGWWTLGIYAAAAVVGVAAFGSWHRKHINQAAMFALPVLASVSMILAALAWLVPNT